jgi:tetratricopeptide (TPR) repeat protein
MDMSGTLPFARLLCLVLAGAFPTTLLAQRAAAPTATLPSLGNHTFRVTTNSRAAQKAFNRGLILAYAFGHEAAAEEFLKAAELDPKLAMAWWGVALVNGPHINFPLVPPDKAQMAWDALTKAQALAPGASLQEQDLIAALARRYANPQPEDRSPLDQAYADAMRELWQKYPRNADVGTLFAESLMDLHPWDLWTTDGQPQPWTDEIVVTLEQALRLNPNQPGANHLLVHAVESSPNPARALTAANRLQKLVPGASHLIHMPAHIYARVGRWDAAAKSNIDAMKVDKIYRAAHAKPGFYAIYMAHNAHFLAFTAMMRGRGDEALKIGRQMIAEMPSDFLSEYGPFVDGYLIFTSEVLMRFGRWNEILAEPKPPEGLPFSLAMWHYTRAVAFNALDRADDSRNEVAAFLAASAAVPPDYHFGNNSASDLLAIAALVLNGEIAARAGQFDAAVTDLREAVRIEDTLRYDEPPDWIQPVRHTLGAVLLSANRPAEAEQVYRTDLERFPENGWSLFGLKQSLQAQGKKAEVAQAAVRFARAWATADVKIDSTCYCQAGR